MPSKRTVATLLKRYDEYTAMRQAAVSIKSVIKDPNVSFEDKLAATAASSRLNEFRFALFPALRELVFSLPNMEDLKAKYLELDDKRSSVQASMRGLTVDDHDKAMEATGRIFDNVQFERDIVDEAMPRIKQNKNEKKNGT